MANFLHMGNPALPNQFGTTAYPASRGRFTTANGCAVGSQSLPTDQIGNYALTMTNMVPGSSYEIEPYAGGASIALGTADATGQVTLNIPVYPGGNSANTLRVKVRQGTVAPYYQPYETQVIASIGSSSLYINQLPDQ
jgi:hypothetical protein